MRRAIAGIWWTPTAEGTPSLVVTAIFFALGGLGGFFLALWSMNDGAVAMAEYIGQFLTAAQEGGLQAPQLPELLWRALRWPLFAFSLGFTAFGVFGVPVLACLRGFFFAFSVTAFARVYGQRGLALAFLLLGIPALAYIPGFLLILTQSFSASCALAGRAGGQGWREGPYHREYFLRCALCGAIVCVGLLLERYLVPALIVGWAQALPR